MTYFVEVDFVVVPENTRTEILNLITFVPGEVNYGTLLQHAVALVLIAASSSTDFVMIGGAPFFQSYSRIAEKVLRWPPRVGTATNQLVGRFKMTATKTGRLRHLDHRVIRK